MSISTSLIGNTQGNIFTSSGNTAITYLSFTNYSGADAEITVYVVPSGDIAGNTNVILANLAITSEDTYQLYAGAEKLLLENGDYVVAQGNAASGINAVVSYTTV